MRSEDANPRLPRWVLAQNRTKELAMSAGCPKSATVSRAPLFSRMKHTQETDNTHTCKLEEVACKMIAFG